ncbi:MAG: DsbA family protein [Pseudomonadota bacterium]
MVGLRVAFALALSAAISGPVVAETLDRAAVETIVREYLLENPQVLEQAFTKLQEVRQAEEAAARVASLEDFRDALFNNAGDPYLGNPDGDVTLVEFFDYNCGFCRRAMEDKLRLVESDPNLKIVLKEFPVLGQASMEAAAISIVVNENHPERYGEFHTALMASEGRVDGAAALRVVDALDLPRADIEAATQSPRVREVVEGSYEIAQALGLSGTPSYVVGDSIEFGAVGYDMLKARVNRARCGSDTC